MNPFPDDAWNAWSPDELFARLGPHNHNWYVVGGWALDLWHGHQARDHEDIEFAVLPAAIDDCRKALSELVFFQVRDGQFYPFAPGDLPAADTWQLWGADPAAGVWRVDMMVERGTQELWEYKRDPSIRMPRTSAVRRTGQGIPYLAPANILLFKAKHRRDKDDRDFETALPKLTDEEKRQLRNWLETLHPDHDWLKHL